MTKYANDHPYKLVVGEGDGIYANDHPYLVEIDGGVVTPEEFEELETKVDALATDLSYKGGVPTYDDLPADPEQGDVYTVEDTGVLYVWDGDEWVALNETKESIKTLTTDDYNYHSSGSTDDGVKLFDIPGGIYKVDGAGSQFGVYMSTSTRNTFADGSLFIISDANVTYNNKRIVFLFYSGATESVYYYLMNANGSGSAISRKVLDNASLINTLTFTSAGMALDARQGKVLNDRIGDLSTLTTTAKTSAVAAINELDSDKEGKTITGSAAPTISTVADNVGQKYYDSTNDKWYVCKAIEEESGGGFSYIWEEQGGGPNVVQTTGTSTTDVMSQVATTRMIYPNGYEQNQDKVRIHLGISGHNDSGSVIIGGDTQYGFAANVILGKQASSTYGPGIAIGANAVLNNRYATVLGVSARSGSSATGGVALGAYSQATKQGEMNVGSTDTSCGYKSSHYRLISGVYPGETAHDAATVGQLPATLTNSQFNSILENA